MSTKTEVAVELVEMSVIRVLEAARWFRSYSYHNGARHVTVQSFDAWMELMRALEELDASGDNLLERIEEDVKDAREFESFIENMEEDE